MRATVCFNVFSAMQTYTDIESKVDDILRKYYDDGTVEEFRISKVKGVSQRIQPIINSLEAKIAKWNQNKI